MRDSLAPRWLLAALLFITLLVQAGPALTAIRVIDRQGQILTLDRPARRIVSLAPHITESLFAVGAGSAIIATVSHSDYPEAALAIPRVGSYDRINRESLVAMKPDLVIAWESGNGADLIDHLRALGLAVFVTEPRRLEDIAANLEAFAALAGRDAEGAAAARAFRARLERLRAAHRDSAPVTVFYQVWNQPLLTLNDAHLIADVIRLCGGTNIFGDAAPLVPVVNTETVLRADPEVVIASGMGEERPDWVDEWRRWPSLRAARNGHLYFIPPSLLQRHAPRILDGAESLCRLLEQARHQRDGGPS